MHKLTRRSWLRLTGVALTAVTFAEDMNGECNPREAEMVPIPGGPFLMGTAEHEAAELAHAYGYHASWLSGEIPQRKLDLPAFYIDKFPVTNEQFHEFCLVTKYAPRPHWKGPVPPDHLLRHPVVFVNKADAMAYAAWAGKRLPTEAEWEKAARGDDGRLYPWGNEFRPGACQCDLGNTPAQSQGASRIAGQSAALMTMVVDMSVPGTAQVDAHPEGASPYGVMDMAGNAAEWCSDSPGPGSAFIKGGCWLTTQPINLRPAARNMSGFDNNASAFYGFRCARSA